MSAGRKNTENKVDYCTPPKYVDAVMKFFDGKLDLDPCTNGNSLLKARISYCELYDGLKCIWEHTDTCFINPPYGRNPITKTTIYDWVDKAYSTNRLFGTEILMLIPVASNTKHFKNIIFKFACGICFLEDTRLKFWSKGKETKKGAPFACCFVYFGRNYDRFNQVFSQYGKTFKI